MKHLLAALIISVTAFACAKQAKPDADTPAPAVAEDRVAVVRTSDTGNALGIETVHFAYKSNTLAKKEKAILKKNVAILKANPNAHVQIEGHCDSRGGTQYNLALGERRAKAVEKYLQVMGVNASRMTVISMGKEKPLDPAETEEAYAKNRRANFVVTE